MAAERPTVLVVGATFIDICFDSVDIPTSETPITFAENAVTCFGGKGFNQAVAARRLADQDTRVIFLTSIGMGGPDDPLSDQVIAALAGERIHSSDIFAYRDMARRLPPVTVMSQGNRVLMVSADKGDLPAAPSSVLSSD